RCETLEELAEGAMLFCGPYTPADDALRAEVMDDTAKTLLDDFRQRAGALPDWTEAELDGLIKAILKDHGAKMPKLAIPLRVAVTGHKHTPSIGAVLALLGRETVLGRLDRPWGLGRQPVARRHAPRLHGAVRALQAQFRRIGPVHAIAVGVDRIIQVDGRAVRFQRAQDQRLPVARPAAGFIQPLRWRARTLDLLDIAH